MLLYQLQCFYELTKHHSISDAATSLHIAQSTLSQTILNLETTLELTLFIRSNKGVNLTPAGLEVLTHTKVILKKVNDIKKISYGHHENTLTLSSYLFLISPQFLQHFKETPHHQSITLTVLESLQSDILTQVADMQSEIGFIQLSNRSKKSINKLADSLQLELIILHTDVWHVNFRPTHRLNAKPHITHHDLSIYPIIFTPTPAKDPLPLKNFVFDDMFLFDFKSVIYLNNSHHILNFLHHSDAFFLSPGFASDEFERAGLVSKPLYHSFDLIEIALVKQKNVPLSYEASLFVEHFSEQFKQKE